MSAVSDLLSSFQHVIESLTPVTGRKGVFDVEVDGEMLYSKLATGHRPPAAMPNQAKCSPCSASVTPTTSRRTASDHYITGLAPPDVAAQLMLTRSSQSSEK